MNVVILLRGHHYLESDRFGFPLDARKYLHSLTHKVSAPLRRNHTVHIVVATYPSPIQEEVLQSINPTSIIMLEKQTSSQISTFRQGLALVRKEHPECDRLICTRFDLIYLKSVLKWNIWDGHPGVFFPWREYKQMWLSHHRVSDTIHVIDRDFLDLFQEELEDYPADLNLHKIYDPLRVRTNNLFFLEDGFYDSNTLYWNAECWNPLYRIANRPRLPLFAPNSTNCLMGKLSEEITSLTSTMARFYFNRFRHKAAPRLTTVGHSLTSQPVRLSVRTCSPIVDRLK